MNDQLERDIRNLFCNTGEFISRDEVTDILVGLIERIQHLEQLRPEQEQGDIICQEDDGCPTELAVLQRFWRGQPIPYEHYPAWCKPAPVPEPAQQEPVAFCVYCDGQFTHNIYHSEDLANFRAAALEEQYPRYKRKVVPLYTAPPHQWSNVTDEALMEEVRRRGFVIRDAQVGHKWVGLTDEEILGVWQKAMVEDNGKHARLDNQPFVHFAKAIEAKLKEKNT